MDRRQFAKELKDELPHLYRYAFSLSHNSDAAEDLVQDCLLRAVSKRDQFEPGTHLRRWLFTILRNINIDRHRQRARRGIHVPINEWHQETHQPAPQQDWMALRDVERRLGELRGCDREILYLSVFAGMRHQTIANRMGIAVGTVKSRLSRARRALAA